jgi:hypothetical protein
MGQASTVEELYDCALPTPVDCDLFVFQGTSLINGYLALLSGLDSQVVTHYFPAGDQTYSKLFISSVFKTLHYSKVGGYYPINLYTYNEEGKFRTDDNFAKSLSEDCSWPRPYFIMTYTQNGASIIAGESSVTWALTDDISEDGTVYPTFMINLLWARDLLKSQGYNPRISVTWGMYCLYETTPSVYVTSINGMIADMRNQLEDQTIRFYINKRYASPADVPTAAWNTAVDTVVAADSLCGKFDLNDFELSADNIHKTTMGDFDHGFVIASYWNEIYYGNKRPVASNVQITGTIKAGNNVGFSFTYTDNENDLQSTVVVGDNAKLRYGTGSRCEIYFADDNVGTNSDYVNKTLNVGDTYNLNAIYIGKYIQGVVFPKAQTGSLHGYPVKSAWTGPIVA